MVQSDRYGTGPFARLLLVRMLREDRTLIAVHEFIRTMDFLEGGGGGRLPAMGPKFVESVADTMDKLYGETHAFSPVIFLLSAGADPTEGILGMHLGTSTKRSNHWDRSIPLFQPVILKKEVHC